MGKIALFAGSFDPFTLGHLSVAQKGLMLFDRLVIGVGTNSEKRGLIAPERRVELIRKVFEGEPRVRVEMYDVLTGDFCLERDIYHILRGLRSASDFEYERQMEMINSQLFPRIESVFVFTPAAYAGISSGLVREVFSMGGDPSAFLPEGVDLREYL